MAEQDKQTDRPISFEEAEAILENERPEFLRKMETPDKATARKESYFHSIAAKLANEGNKLPVSVKHAETAEGVGPVVQMPLSKWRNYFLDVAQERAGVKISNKKMLSSRWPSGLQHDEGGSF